ncbi:MAG: type II toxin-antitoxin system RelE/ParE family toxin [Chthoniobacterales bacterium]
MTYAFHPEARVEYREAARFYEERQIGLGAAFAREVEATIERILEAPDRWRAIEQDVRRCFMHTFPYGILYTIEEDYVLVIAVAHASREPGFWRERLSR